MEKLAKREENDRLFMFNLSFNADMKDMFSFYKWKQNYDAGIRIIDDKIEEHKAWLEK